MDSIKVEINKKDLKKLDANLRAIIVNEMDSIEFTKPFKVSINFTDNTYGIERLGFKPSSFTGNFVSGTLNIQSLAEIVKHPNVIYVEKAHVLKPK